MKKIRRTSRDKSDVDGGQARTTKRRYAGAYSKKTLDKTVMPMTDNTTAAIDVGDNEEEASRQSDTFTASEIGHPVFERETNTSDSLPGAFPTSPSGDVASPMVSTGTINIGYGTSYTDRVPSQPHTYNNRTPSDQPSSTLTSETYITATVVNEQGQASTIDDNERVPEPKPLGEVFKDPRIRIIIAILMGVILATVSTVVALVVTGGKGNVSGSTRAPMDGNAGSPSTLVTSNPTSSTEGSMTPTPNATPEPSTSPPTTTMAPTSQLKDVFDFLNASSFDQGLALQNTLSPQYKSFQWLLAEFKVEAYSREHLLQRHALNTFYYILQNSYVNPWLSLNQSIYECDWPLVSCNANGFVNTFNIAGKGIQAMVPGEFGFLTHMTSLSLEGNKMTGSLPPSLEKWTRLEAFEASSNLLTGSFPEFSHLTTLTSLDLSMNQFTGRLPSSLSGMSSLQRFSIATNAFSGPIPSDLWTLTDLQYVFASNNTLSGTISAGIVNAPVLLEVFLDMNNFTGKIPKGLGTLGNTAELLKLELAKNALTGEIPSSFGGLVQLTTLALTNNSLTGSIPSQLGSLTDLVGSLDLSGNKLVGAIPTELGRLRKLSKNFNLERNQLNGTIPSELGFLTNLELLFSLAFNNLSGSIPTTLGGLNTLSKLHLQVNKNMNGTIPFQLGQMKTMSEFVAFNNELNGSVPESVCNLTVTGYLTSVEVNCALNCKCICCLAFCY